MKRFLNGLFLVLLLAACAPLRSRSDAPAVSGPDVSVLASVPPAEVLDAESVTRFALSNHPEVAAELARIELAEADIVQAGLLRNPMLSLMSMRPEGGGRVEIEAGWMQSLADWLTRSKRVALADAKADRVRIDVATRLFEIGIEAQLALYEAVGAAAREQLLKADLDLDEQSLALQTRFLGQGIGARSEFLKAQAMRDQRLHEWHEAMSEAALERTSLAERMGLSSAEGLHLPDDVGLSETATPDAAAALDQALRNRFDLKLSALDIDVVAREGSLETSRAMRSETELGLRLLRDGEGMAMVGPELRIALPWFDFGQAQTARFAAMQREAQARDAAVRSRISIEVERGLVVLAHAIRTAEEANRHLERAIATETLAERSYRHGVGERMEHIDAQRAVVEAKRHAIAARVAVAKAGVELQRALGRVSATWTDAD